MLVNTISQSQTTLDTVGSTGRTLPLNIPQMSVLKNIVRKVPVLAKQIEKDLSIPVIQPGLKRQLRT
jgi:hypothetical protein